MVCASCQEPAREKIEEVEIAGGLKTAVTCWECHRCEWKRWDGWQGRMAVPNQRQESAPGKPAGGDSNLVKG